MAIETFKQYLIENKINEIEILVSVESTRTAQEAANTHNVPVCNIVKSLLVRIDDSFKMFLVPGDRRLDIDYLKKEYNTENVTMANADEVKEITGFSIGGVPPFGHKNSIPTIIVDGFDKNSLLVAAAGSQNSVFKIDYDRLKALITIK